MSPPRSSPVTPAARAFLQALDRVLDSVRHGPEFLRDRALVLLLFATGLTPAEAAGLTIADYIDEHGKVRSVSQLRPEIANRHRGRPLLFVHDQLIAAMDAYLAQRARPRRATKRASQLPPPSRTYRGFAPDARLILGNYGRTLKFNNDSRNGVRRGSRAFDEVCLRAFGGKRVGIYPKDARRLLARALFEEGADLIELQKILGVKSRQKLLLLLEDSGDGELRVATVLRRLR